jgi:flagellar biosynthetic protein FliR
VLLNIDQGWLVQICLASIRIGMLFILTPVFYNMRGVTTARVLLVLALSVGLAANLAPAPRGLDLAYGPLLAASAGEVATGAVLSFGLFAAFSAFSVAGKILDIQSGFSIGSVYDPVTGGGAPVFATVLNLAAVAMFFAMDGHHALVRGIAYSLHQVPPGTGLTAFDPEAVVRQFGVMFTLGVAMAGPVMFGLFLAEIALAVISRSLPQMNVFVVGVPVKIVIALALLALSAGLLGPVMGRVYASVFLFWERVL